MTINEAIQILGLQQPVTLVKIKQQYRAKAREFHPDASGEATDEAFIKIKFAYETLKDKTEFELNNQIFKARVDYAQMHKPIANRGFYQLPNTVLMQDVKNVIYFFYKYFKINWVNIFYHTYSKLDKVNEVSKPIKYLQTVLVVMLILLGLPILLAFLFCSSVFYFLNVAMISNNEKFKHHTYYNTIRQILMWSLAFLFFYMVYKTMPMFITIAFVLFTLPAICLLQLSLLYSFLNRN